MPVIQKIREKIRSLRRSTGERDPAWERKMETEREEMKREVLENSRPRDQSGPTVL
ncbi:MAG: hypothetical protein H0U03_05440 [Actinobacteria bacterium]|nr:hypothetical protein [Actinomycetota bacterium]